MLAFCSQRLQNVEHYRRAIALAGLTPDLSILTADDLRKYLGVTDEIADDVLTNRANNLNALFEKIPEGQRKAFIEKALTGELGGAVRKLPDNELKLAWFEDMLASYEPNLPDGQQLLDAFVSNSGRVKAWDFVRAATGSNSAKRLSVDILESVSKHLDDADFMTIIGNGNIQSGYSHISPFAINVR